MGQHAVRRRRRWAGLVPLVALLVLATGCSTPTGATTAASTSDQPHAATAMVCEPEAEHDITKALGLSPSQPPTPTWSDRLFTCSYRYGDAVMLVSVKELADAVAARTWFGQQQATATNALAIPDLGDAAFISNGVATVVLKGAVVLRVDVSRLPDVVGPNAVPRNHVGISVASVILGCWVGD
jgi:hypothetical protein